MWSKPNARVTCTITVQVYVHTCSFSYQVNIVKLAHTIWHLPPQTLAPILQIFIVWKEQRKSDHHVCPSQDRHHADLQETALSSVQQGLLWLWFQESNLGLHHLWNLHLHWLQWNPQARLILQIIIRSQWLFCAGLWECTWPSSGPPILTPTGHGSSWDRCSWEATPGRAPSSGLTTATPTTRSRSTTAELPASTETNWVRMLSRQWGFMETRLVLGLISILPTDKGLPQILSLYFH